MDHFKYSLYIQCHLSHFPATVCGHTSHLSYEKQKKGGRWGEEKGEKRHENMSVQFPTAEKVISLGSTAAL